MDVNKIRGRQFQNQNELVQALGTLFIEDRAEYIRQYEIANSDGGGLFSLVDKNNRPLLNDCIQEAGTFDQDYFFQDIWGRGAFTNPALLMSLTSALALMVLLLICSA